MRDKYPDFVERLEKEGMVSRRVMGEEDDPSSAIGRGWKSMFSTDDKLVAEQRFVFSLLSLHRFPFTFSRIDMDYKQNLNICNGSGSLLLQAELQS
ncbi:unnamed protein product [Linum tenue]|uniref:Uncharacterized protein n=1 Tax=Linum tenue TaxID=586396 RepID=A0AAV0KMJ0_9ROSI|nr:unnamed protein product [Linum tenue]